MQNPFEQLNNLQPGAEHCFEEVVSNMLRATIPDAKRVRVYRGDGGVDTFTGTWGALGELEVYQIKYFVTQWGSSQKQQIRDSYRTAADNTDYNLLKWILVVPTNLTSKDFTWFDEWRAKEKHEIEMINGSDLSDRLQLPRCAGARQMLRKWGVLGLGASPAIDAWVRLTPARSFALVANVWLQNIGDQSLRSARLRVEHSETETVAIQADEYWWHQPQTGMFTSLNPRQLEAVRVINPGEKVRVMSVPFREMPDGEVWVRMRLTAEDIAPIETMCRFLPQNLNLQEIQRFPFAQEQ
jgi:hypothetical protein